MLTSVGFFLPSLLITFTIHENHLGFVKSFLDPNYNLQARRAQSAFFCSKLFVPEEVALMGKGSEFLCEQPLSMASRNLGPRPPPSSHPTLPVSPLAVLWELLCQLSS